MSLKRARVLLFFMLSYYAPSLDHCCSTPWLNHYISPLVKVIFTLALRLALTPSDGEDLTGKTVICPLFAVKSRWTLVSPTAASKLSAI